MSNPNNHPPGKFGLATSEEEKKVQEQRRHDSRVAMDALKAEMIPKLEAMYTAGKGLPEANMFLAEQEAEYRQLHGGHLDGILHSRTKATFGALSTTYGKWIERDERNKAIALQRQRKRAAREIDYDASPIEVLRDLIQNAEPTVAIQAAYTILKRAGAVVASTGTPVFVRPVYDATCDVSLAQELERLSVPETDQESDVELAMQKLRTVATGYRYNDNDRNRAAQHLLKFDAPGREQAKRPVMVVRGNVTGVPVTEVKYGRS